MARGELLSGGTIVGLAIVGGVLGYMTNFGGIRNYLDVFLRKPDEPVPPPGGTYDDFEDPKQVPKPEPPISPGTKFECVSYPRCNSVAGTDDRKRCCCKNKCSLLKKSNQTMSPTVNFATGQCLCNFKTTSVPKPNCTGPCPLGKKPGLISGKCGCVSCTNTCTTCYKRVSNCGCKWDDSVIRTWSGASNCKIGCNGYTSWTNFPCPNRGARTQSVVKVSGSDATKCNAARTKWLQQWGCKSSYAHMNAYLGNANPYDQLGMVPTIA